MFNLAFASKLEAAGAGHLDASLPLSLYIHYPFCRRKCPYCDFFSVVKGADASLDLVYAQRLTAELCEYIPLLEEQGKKRIFTSVFIGGGTPSLMSIQALDLIFEAISPFIDESTEITMEANPGTLKADFVRALKSAGVNRISLGAQSFNDKGLKLLGRIHNVRAIYEALDLIGADFRVNLDVMHALPGQSLEEALDDLKAAIACRTEHLSWYELTIEEGTAFYEHPPKILLDEDEKAALDEEGFALLAKAGYRHYEVSAFTQDRVCAHNVNYWRFGDYLGLGAGAHGKLSVAEGILRTQNLDDITHYLKHDAEIKSLSFKDAMPDLLFEYALNRLRLNEPCSYAEVKAYLRADPAACGLIKILEEGSRLGLAKLSAEGFALTSKGQRLLSDLMLLFLPE